MATLTDLQNARQAMWQAISDYKTALTNLAAGSGTQAQVDTAKANFTTVGESYAHMIAQVRADNPNLTEDDLFSDPTNETAAIRQAVADIMLTGSLLNSYLIVDFPFTNNFKDTVQGLQAVPGSGVSIDQTAHDLNLPRNNGSVDLGTLPAFGNQWSILIQIYPINLDNTYAHLLTDYRGQAYGAFKLDHNGQPYFFSTTSGSLGAGVSNGLGKWSNLAFTYDGTNLTFWGDPGSANPRSSVLKNLSIDLSAARRWYTGGDGGNEYTYGAEKNLQIYNRCLTQAQLTKAFGNM